MICILLDILFYILSGAFFVSILVQIGVMGALVFDITKTVVAERSIIHD